MGWLSGWDYRQTVTIPSSSWSLSGNLSNQVVKVPVPSSNTSFWAGVKTDGTDVRFTASDGSTLLDFEIEKFDNTADDAIYHVEVSSLLSASDTVIYVYYGNAGASSGENINGTWDSNFKAVWHLSQNKAAGAFADSTSNANNGTNNGTTDIAGQIDRGRNFAQASSQYIAVADADSLSFGNGSADTELTFEAWVKMTDATNFRIFSKEDASAAGEFTFYTSSVDKLALICYDANFANRIARGGSDALTADEGTFIHLVATYDGSGSGSGINLYRNGVLMNMTTPSSAGTYVAMENTGQPFHLGRAGVTGAWTYANGSMDEVTLSAAARSVDWIKARYQSGATSSWTFGNEELFKTVTDTLTLTDAIDATLKTITVTDVLSLADGTVLYQTITVTDSVTLTDIFTVDTTHLVTITDSLTLAESVETPLRTITVTDVVTLTDSTVLLRNISVTDSFTLSDVVEAASNNSLLWGAPNFPAGQVGNVEYRIMDQNETLVQDWTATGVFEHEVSPTKSTYAIKNIILVNGFQGFIDWRIAGTRYYSSKTINYYESWISTYASLPTLEEITALVETRLAASDYTAPDNTGIAANGAAIGALPTLAEMLAGGLALESTLTTILGIVTLLNKYARNKKQIWRDTVTGVKYLIIYDNDGSTELIRKSLKDPSGADISNIVAGAMALENASDV